MSWFRKDDRPKDAARVWGEVDLTPSLAAVVQQAGQDRAKLTVALPLEAPGRIAIKDRTLILVDDGDQVAEWRVPSLRELFRGERPPPGDAEMDRYPIEYVWFFARIEQQLVTLCDELGQDPTDGQMLDIYTAMRRRPDGQSLSPLHDAIWQFGCLAVAYRPVSAAEFEACFRRLARSARTFRMGDASRNYLTQVRRMLGQGEPNG